MFCDDELDLHHHGGGEDVLFWVNCSFNFRSQLPDLTLKSDSEINMLVNNLPYHDQHSDFNLIFTAECINLYLNP